MTQKVNGAVKPGAWFERNVAFVKVTFNKDVAALLEADLVKFGTATPVSPGTVANSGFDVVESALAQALSTLSTKATVIGVSNYDAASFSVDVVLGHAEGWFADANGLIASALPLAGARAVVTTAGADMDDQVGAVVGVAEGAVTFNLSFVTMDGKMTVATLANGALALGPGATSGATPVASPTGTSGYYPGTV